tara:strand:+ start:244 stop:690 length:447 start_codon:yes stop_codon:yes gene_type:complete
MQKERVQIISKQIVQKNIKTVHIVKHPDHSSSVDDIAGLFGKYVVDNLDTEYPVLNAAFRTLKHYNNETLFVFVKRNQNNVLGILRSNRVLYNEKELKLLGELGDKTPYNYPLFTFNETNVHFEAQIETICRNRHVIGPCFAIFCYRN